MKVLVIAPAWVGDMVMAHCLVQVLAARDPQLDLHLVAPPATAPLGERMTSITAVHVLDVGHGRLGLAARRSLARTLRPLAFDRAFVLPNSWKSALLPWLAGVPVRTGFRGEQRYGLLNDLRVLDAERLPRMVDRFVALVSADRTPTAPIPAPRLRQDGAAAATLRERLGLRDPAPVLACCPGAEFGPAKRWPPEHFAALIERRVAAGWQAWLFGAPKDAETSAEVLALLPAPVRTRVHDLAGRTRLPEAVDLLGDATAVVSNDSGLMHVACALQRTVVAVYGSTSPRFTPPLGDRVTSISLQLACSPCFQRSCPLGHLDCLRQLDPLRVDAALDRLLTDAPSASASP